MFIILQLKRVNEGFVRFLREFVEFSFDENSWNAIEIKFVGAGDEFNEKSR